MSNNLIAHYKIKGFLGHFIGALCVVCALDLAMNHFKEALKYYFTNFINIYTVTSREATILITSYLQKASMQYKY